ncbi:MAG: PAS sensor [Geobacteraceae bacterium]|nr:MAG: PAS sensor [Geobacteraceae bacterium]
MQGYDHDWLCRRIVEKIGDAILFSDREGIIRLWNAGAEIMFGFKAEEAIGRSLDIITPENLRARHWEGYYRVMETGVSRYEKELLAVPALRKDGERISVEFSMALIRNGAGEILGVAAVARNVTARWQREKSLRERLAALEAQVGEMENR